MVAPVVFDFTVDYVAYDPVREGSMLSASYATSKYKTGFHAHWLMNYNSHCGVHGVRVR